MKKLLITLLLISPFSFADWGDVYYCQMTNHVDTHNDGTVERFKLEKFQFKLDKEKNAMVFGKSGYFADSVKTLDLNDSYLPAEMWVARTRYTATEYQNGQFLFAGLFIGEIVSVTANCDKF
jgi:hypothetical protein